MQFGARDLLALEGSCSETARLGQLPLVFHRLAERSCKVVQFAADIAASFGARRPARPARRRNRLRSAPWPCDKRLERRQRAAGPPIIVIRNSTSAIAETDPRSG